MEQKKYRSKTYNNRKNKGKFLEFRNRDVVKLFHQLGINIRLVGNPEYPNLIMDNKFKLPVRVSGNEMIIYDKFEGEEQVIVELGKDKITDENIQHIKDSVMNAMIGIERKGVYKIKIRNSGNLYLHDFRYTSLDGKDFIKHPVFSFIDPKIIHTEEHAKEVMDDILEQWGWDLIIEYPEEIKAA